VIMAVPIGTTPELKTGRPRPLFEGNYIQSAWYRPSFDVTPDGQRFVMIQRDVTASALLHVVLSWFAELERLVPTN
jgi:hypothetical protein